ncbi:uncharacterized protein RJT21DRAFT_12920 [Scheffersomyces amazonensis]|uniref:uncharacterized protein n=1 Tax=Scheffersomyces amazonensis TaxID=1078765 RepID=UPI00315D4918
MTTIKELTALHELLESEKSVSLSNLANVKKVFLLHKEALTDEKLVLFNIYNLGHWIEDSDGSSSNSSSMKELSKRDLAFAPTLEYTKNNTFMKSSLGNISIKNSKNKSVSKVFKTTNKIYVKYDITKDSSKITMLMHHILPISDIKIGDDYYRWIYTNTKSEKDSITFKGTLYKLGRDQLNMFNNNIYEKDSQFGQQENYLLTSSLTRNLVIDLHSDAKLKPSRNATKLAQLIYHLNYKDKTVTNVLVTHRVKDLKEEEAVNTAVLFRFNQDTKFKSRSNLKGLKYTSKMGIKKAF